MSNKDLSFEEAYSRLEKILEKMGSASVSLEESISLYEEADTLLNLCNAKLDGAEKKIQIMIKSRTGEVVYGEDGKPLVEDFTKENERVLFEKT
jgi:exodeoxyribonuclease VII small subunit